MHTPAHRVIAVVVLLPLLSSCASVRGAGPACDPEYLRQMNAPDSSFLGRIKDHPDDTAAYQDYANHMWLYAQMAKNAYPPKAGERRFVLPDSIRTVEVLDDSAGTGFAATVFELGPQRRPSRIVIGFRGTEGTFLFGRDWRNGNILSRQQHQALALFRRIRARYAPPAYPDTIPLAVTGHSLGGALAIEASRANDGTLTYVFNTSYRQLMPHRGRAAESPRVSIAETGEIVRFVRWVLPNPTILHLKGYDCTEGGPVENHSMWSFAHCLTQVAAAEMQGARDALARNPVRCDVASSPRLSPAPQRTRAVSSRQLQ